MVEIRVIKIVGASKLPGPLCGNVTTKYEACKAAGEGHYKKFLPLGCGDRGCPICYKRVVSREAHKATDRMRGIHDAWLKKGADLGIPVHWILSPPPGRYDHADEEDCMRAREKNNKYAKMLGMVGGCAVMHHTRGTPTAYKRLHEGLIPVTSLKLGFNFHNNGFAPTGMTMTWAAFNLITSVNPGLDTRENRRTGWVVKEKPYVVKKIATVYNVVKYELGHASYFDGRQMLTWFGLCAPNATKVSKQKVKEACYCKVRGCKSPIGIYMKSDFPDHDDDYLYDKIEVKILRKYSIPVERVERLRAKYSLPVCIPKTDDLLAYAIIYSIYDNSEVKSNV